MGSRHKLEDSYQEKRKRGHGSCEEAMAGVSSSSFEIACMGILKFCLVIALSIGEWFLPSSHCYLCVRLGNNTICDDGVQNGCKS